MHVSAVGEHLVPISKGSNMPSVRNEVSTSYYCSILITLS